jgi:hypothetical protein
MRIRSSGMFLGLGAVLAFGVRDAEAKKDKEADTTAEASTEAPASIQTTGIKEFDDVFTKAKDMHTTLDSAQAKLKSANDNVNTTLGLAAGTPFKTALADLKTKADGKIKVAMNGSTPTLSVEDGVPDNVKAAVDATNTAITDVTTTIASLAALPDQAKALTTECQAFPGKLNASMITASGLKVTDLPKVTKTLKSNVVIVSQTPDRAKAVVDEATGMIGSVSSAFVP